MAALQTIVRSPAKLEELRACFEKFLNSRCKGKEASKLRFVVE